MIPFFRLNNDVKVQNVLTRLLSMLNDISYMNMDSPFGKEQTNMRYSRKYFLVSCLDDLIPSINRIRTF